MAIIKPAEEFYSFTVQKRYGKPYGFGQLIFAFNRFGDDDEKTGIYQRQPKRLNFFDGISNKKGHNIYRRLKYYYPSNPNTPAQESNRSKFADAVAAWQALTDEEKSAYNNNNRVSRMSPYNKFISDWLKSH